MKTGKVPEIVRLNESSPAPDAPTRDLRGHRVFDRAGVEIGVVEGMLLDAAERRVRLLRVAPRSPLGSTSPPVLVPVEAIDRLEADRLSLDAMRERVLSGPPDDPAATPTPDHWAGLYAYYGVAPFWIAADDGISGR